MAQEVSGLATALCWLRYGVTEGGDAATPCVVLVYSGILSDTAIWVCGDGNVHILQSIARPSGRAGHSMALLRMPGGKDVLVVHGGRTKDSRLCKDTWLLELAS